MSRPSQTPLVSIALPVYNGADTVAHVVESVLAQTHSNLELVISDNASTDGTQEICRRFARADSRVVYQRHADERRPAQQLLRRRRTQQGPYVRRIGDDDSLEPDYVSRGSSRCSRRTRAGSW